MMDVAVDGMTCGHCVRAVTEALASLPGVAGVAVELETGTVHIQGNPDSAAVRRAIEDEGYTVKGERSPSPAGG